MIKSDSKLAENLGSIESTLKKIEDKWNERYSSSFIDEQRQGDPNEYGSVDFNYWLDLNTDLFELPSLKGLLSDAQGLCTTWLMDHS